MAINDRPDLTCATYWKHDPGPPAVALVRGDRTESDGEFWPECQACVDERIADPDPYPHDIVYLDPARVRGTATHNNAATPTVHRTFTDLPPDLIS